MARLSRTQRQKALEILEGHGIVRLSDVVGKGIHPSTLARLVEEGIVVRSSRGIYEMADAEVDLSHDLAAMSRRVPRGIVCLISALRFHEITLQTPRGIWMAIGEKDRRPRIQSPPVRFVRFGQQALSAGVETHRIDSVPVKIFSPAKTVVDCFRYRRAVGLDVALEALRLALRTRKATPEAIVEYARKLRIWSVLRPYLESAVADEG